MITSEQFSKEFKDGFLGTQKLLRKIGVPAHLVEDVAQAAWAKGWEKRGQFRNNNADLLPWINSIAVNHFLRIIRRESGNKFSSTEKAGICTGNTEKTLNTRIDLDIARESQKRDFDLLILKYEEGHSYEEIRAMIGVAHQETVKTRIHREKIFLRKRLGIHR